jgi:hypothetical protein
MADLTSYVKSATLIEKPYHKALTTRRRDELETMTNTDERPVLLLDIDGVLNLFPKPLDLHARVKGTASANSVEREHDVHRVVLDAAQIHPYTVRIPADLPSLIAQLSEHYDIHWYTMWNASANRVFAPLAGIPEFPHFQCDWIAGEIAFEDAESPWWMRKHIWIAKTPLIPGFVGSRPFLWIDDDSNEVDTMWLEAHPGVGNFQLITVPPHTGLTQAVVDEAIEWARSLTIQEEYAS